MGASVAKTGGVVSSSATRRNKQMKSKESKPTEPTWLDLRKKISVKEAAEITGISIDTFERHHGHLIRKVSTQRRVVELGDVLEIGSKKGDAA
jgi:hypothetical protein